MHEMGVAAGVLDLVLEKAAGRRLTALTMAVGVNAGIFKDSFLFYMDLLLEEKGLKGVKVNWRDVPVRCRCDCGREYETFRFMDPCPSCGSFKRSMEGGWDCQVESIEVEDG